MAVVVPYIVMAGISMAVGYVMTSIAAKKINAGGSRLGDIAVQTSKEGGPRTIVWGVVRPIGGNLVACSDPVISNHRDNGVRYQEVSRTYAIGICEGPATVRRVWRNNKLVYDGRADSEWGATNNGTFLQKATFYDGDYTQLPDPSLEAYFGIGNVPAMRGTCYMVMNNEYVTDVGGAVPQWMFEVCRTESE